MSKKWKIREGQRYIQRPATNARPVIWEVRSVIAETAPIAHARLIKVDDPRSLKTISCETLADPAFYELLADAPGRDTPGPT